MFFNRSTNGLMPSLANMAADTLLQNATATLKSYKDRFLQIYPQVIRQFTHFDFSRLQTAIQRLNLPSEVMIYTTGSDGKQEKSCRKESPVELIVICDSESKAEVIEKIESLVKSGLLPMDDRIEYKDLKSDSLILCDSTHTVIPSRFLHNLPLMGSEEQFDELTLKFVKDLQQMNKTDRKKFVKKFVTGHSKQMVQVLEGKDTRDVDLAKGVISYSGMGRKATKYSLLRPIQYTLDLILVDAIRSKDKAAEEYAQILKEMPGSVVDQIDYMRKLGLLAVLSDEDITNLKQAYTLGLFYFQTAQHLVTTRNDGQVHFLIPDKEELEKAYKDTQAILAKLRPAKH